MRGLHKTKGILVWQAFVRQTMSAKNAKRGLSWPPDQIIFGNMLQNLCCSAGKESGILQQLRVEVPLAALVTVNSRDAEGTLECQHPDSEPSSPFYDPTKPSLPCYEYVPRRPLSDDMCGSQPYPVLPVTAQAATSEGRQGTQAALTGQQPHQV